MSAMDKGKPSRQATSGGVAMAVAGILAYGLRQAGLEVPPEIVGMAGTVIGYIGGRLG